MIAGNGPSIVMYGAMDSPDTRAAIRFFEERGAAYTLRDTTKPAVRQDMFQRFGVLVIPVVVIGRQAFFGFEANKGEIGAALRAATSPS